MIIYVDIGNSFIHYGYQGLNGWYYSKISHEDGALIDDSSLWIDGVVISRVIYCSVVPKLSIWLEAWAHDHDIDITCCIFDKMLFGFTNKASDKTGIDRLVNIIYAKRVIAPPFMVIDAGTAITYDVVDEQGDFAGGLIAPGIRLMLQSLNKAAQLPALDSAIGDDVLLQKTSHDAMQQGVYYQLVGGYHYAVSRFEALYGKPCQHIITGGDGALLHRLSQDHGLYIQDLTLQSLRVFGDVDKNMNQ